MYLREWAKKLDVPILCVDYTLIPEASFPRALEEIFYTYCWALKNPELVGSTGKNVVIVGDSAGGGLAAGVIIKCIELGIPKPKGFFNAYGIFAVNFASSPSRFKSLYDPCLPMKIVLNLIKNYGNAIPLRDGNTTKKESASTNALESGMIPKAPADVFYCEITKDYLLSPFWAPDEILREFPPTKSVTTYEDPSLDDCVDFCKKLKGLNVDTRVDVLGNLPHGFLPMTGVRKF